MADPTPPTKSGDLHRFNQLGEGGDTSPRDAGYSRPDPDQRSSDPDPASTNYTHAAAPGTRIEAPGEGVMSLGEEIGGPAHTDPDRPAAEARRDPAKSRSFDHIADGVNRVEDDLSASSPRLSVPTDDVGPSSRSVEGMPELADPNYTAATPGARGIPAKDSPLKK